MIPGCASPAIGLMIATSLLGPAHAQPVSAPAPAVQAPKPAVPAGHAPVPQGPAPQDPMEVTTDTPEYCVQLANKVHSMSAVAVAQPPREVSDLSAEGQRMCAHGQTRPGITRLRRAIMLMKQEDPRLAH